MRLHLVRHGHPEIDPTTPASTWPLDPAADLGIEALRGSGVLPGDAVWLSSVEPKALATTQRLSPDGSCDSVEGLHEAERPADWLSQEEFTAAVRRSFAHPDVTARERWEPLSEVGVRVATAVGAVVNEARQVDATDVVLVGHGTAWTLLVSALIGEAPDLDSWELMSMPDHCCIDVDARVIVSPWGHWRAAP
jgi:broad specificity phosphatase PhoE